MVNLDVPNHSIRNNTFTGVSSLYYNWYPTPVFRKLSLRDVPSGTKGQFIIIRQFITESSNSWTRFSDYENVTKRILWEIILFPCGKITKTIPHLSNKSVL